MRRAVGSGSIGEEIQVGEDCGERTVTVNKVWVSSENA